EAAEDLEKLFSSAAVRETMRVETESRCGGKSPRWYQIDPGEAFLLGMDVILVSLTGSGKTLAFCRAYSQISHKSRS
ncbi:hypothetical protein BC835DRAFT_1277252, partial [Cytidiella melzeri]